MATYGQGYNQDYLYGEYKNCIYVPVHQLLLIQE